MSNKNIKVPLSKKTIKDVTPSRDGAKMFKKNKKVAIKLGEQARF